MAKELKYAFYAIKKNIQNSAELRVSFVMNILGMIFNNLAFVFLWMTFAYSVGTINGWTAVDIVGLQGFVTLSFGVICSALAGINKIASYVATGVFDRFLLSPKNLIISAATSDFGVSALGDVIYGVVCLVIYGFLINSGTYEVLLILFLSLIATVVYLSATIAISATSFLFTDSDTAVNGLFELFLSPSLFHGGAFQGVMRFVFTFIVPSLLIGTLPVEIVRTLSFEKLALVSTLAVFWFFVSIKLFYRGVRKYESSNLMTFGR